ncbi:RNA polymerase sigma factor [Elstera litoralis]|uniref:RNA polymerase sigma factor n=1 Tax=Elstera litoralis TaxID=552518 RepID=UPI001E38AD52|nr:RNA polymerase sigma factor [Elstera litoralis]
MSASLNAIYLDQRRSLLWRALRIVRDVATAEDVLQESYLRAHKAAEKAPIENIGAFLHRTAQNLALDHVRRRKTKERFEYIPAYAAEPLEVPCQTPSAEDRLIQQERLNQVKAALDALPERARQVWTLNRVEGWPYPKIAKHLACRRARFSTI